MSVDKPSLIYRFTKRIVRLVYRPPFTCVGTQNLPDEPCIVAGNHSQIHGPLSMELYPARNRYTWCVAEMMHFKEVPAYAYRDFWSRKPKSVSWLFKIVSYLIAPLAVMLFNNAQTIPVYHDNRLLETFRTTVRRLCEGADVVIFPEKDEPYNDILYQFQEGFAEVALFYGKKTGKSLSFVPMYLCPERREIHYGVPTFFDTAKPAKQEAARVRQYLMDEITAMAKALPRHRVVPYRNMPQKDFPYSK